MSQTVKTEIKDFTGGITNDPRDPRGNVFQAATNFDIFTDSKRAIPAYDSESGDSGASTSQKQNFCVALYSPTPAYRLFALGVVSGTGRAEVLMKDLSTGGSADLSDAGWATPAGNQSASGATSFNLFLYYKTLGKILGARAGTHIWAFTPDGTTAWADTYHAINYTNIAQGLVHSKDDIAYIPYDNKIAKCDNGVWTDAALTLPSHLYITSISERGNFLAIAASPLSGVGSSRVYLWDRDSTLTTLSENYDWGEGELKVLEEVEGVLMGISVSATARNRYRVIFRAVGYEPLEFNSTTSPVLLIAKQRIDKRLYFMMKGTFNGAVREGVFSMCIKNGRIAVAHERTPDNNTATGNGALKNFFIVGDYMFISYVSSTNVSSLSKTNDQASYTATSILETVIYNSSDSAINKKFHGISLTHQPLPAAGQIVLKYRKDAETNWTTIFTHTTDDSLGHSTKKIEATSENLPNHKEIAFRIESTGGAVPTGLSFECELLLSKPYG